MYRRLAVLRLAQARVALRMSGEDSTAVEATYGTSTLCYEDPCIHRLTLPLLHCQMKRYLPPSSLPATIPSPPRSIRRALSIFALLSTATP
ncbi:hypothetical protein RTBOTA2_005199 [Rhodotorula toruloides]|nr:hypothetical protein RTBOTA2_005199 [Rhodotorula toruloides]